MEYPLLDTSVFSTYKKQIDANFDSFHFSVVVFYELMASMINESTRQLKRKMNKKTSKKVKKENSLKVEQYLYSVDWSDVDEAFVARVAEFPSLAAHGETQEEALREIKNVVEFALKDLTESKEPIPEPFGKRSFRG
ncbi:MAG: type II toxin-antitoxin system HicB family antitoxin [Acidobacteria bacterium]|nr:type II toxin-antitoxin system HicB family antitoxin [Acidobacteriota bacterium]MCA1637741.1 type II toxin-antitoxin system HicB family antitoxin [Acidobacteriota bacterium]